MVLNTAEEVVNIISVVSGFEPNGITADTNFAEELDIDSIKAIEITVAIEKKFKISIRDEDVPNITTVGEAIQLAKKLLKETSAK